jgi:hypothetical protein
MVTFSGAAGVVGVTDGGGGATGVLVDRVGEGRRVGVWDGLAVLVREADGEAEGEADTCGDGVALVSCEGDESLISIGITMSAPTTKNTAAIATRETCIGVLRRWGAHLRDLVSDLGPYSADYPGVKGA